MTNKGFSAVAFIVVLALAGTAGGGWYVWQAQKSEPVTPAEQAADSPTEAAAVDRVLSGSFEGVAPQLAAGSVILVREDGSRKLQLGDDFMVSDGPDLFLGFGNDGQVDQTTLFAELKSKDGQQEYDVPETINIDDYSEIYVHSKKFSVDYALAPLR